MSILDTHIFFSAYKNLRIKGLFYESHILLNEIFANDPAFMTSRDTCNIAVEVILTHKIPAKKARTKMVESSFSKCLFRSETHLYLRFCVCKPAANPVE